jgi:hypothetical protein
MVEDVMKHCTLDLKLLMAALPKLHGPHGATTDGWRPASLDLQQASCACILKTLVRIKGAAVRCRERDGRAAILLVVDQGIRLPGWMSASLFDRCLTHLQPDCPRRPHCFSAPGPGPLGGGDMLFKIGLLFLAVWLVGVLGAFEVGEAIHVLLLVGGLLLLIGFLHAREDALRRAVGGDPPTQP